MAPSVASKEPKEYERSRRRLFPLQVAQSECETEVKVLSSSLLLSD